jgi:pilus assembly protein Flp/PilA
VNAIRTNLRKLSVDARGATAIEYGLICALIVLGMMSGLQALGGGTNGMWGKILSNVNTYM